MSGSFVLTAALLLAFFTFVIYRKANTEKLMEEKAESLKKLHGKQAFYISSGCEQIDKDLIQFYGRPFAVTITPGMKLTAPDGREYPIKEVYADDSTPGKPDQSIPEANKHTAILIETPSFNWDISNEAFKRDKVLALKIGK